MGESIIQKAKEGRKLKMQSAKDAAETELRKFRQDQEAAFEQDRVNKESANAVGDRSQLDEKELLMVQQDYEANKSETVDYIVKKVLDVPIGLTSTQIQALQSGTV